MRKLLGYIPLDPEESHLALMKTDDVKQIDGTWFKLAEVWIPGVALRPTVPTCFKATKAISIVPGGVTLEEVCEYCSQPRDKHTRDGFCLPTETSKK